MKNIWIQRRKTHYIVDFADNNDIYCPGYTINKKFESIYGLMNILSGKDDVCHVVLGTNIAYLFETCFCPGDWRTPYAIPLHKVGVVNRKFDITISALVDQNMIYLDLLNRTKMIEIQNWMI